MAAPTTEPLATPPGALADRLYKLVMFIACTAITAMMAVTFVDVLGRHLFSAVPGASEIISMLLGVSFYAGMSAVQRTGAHIAVGILVDRYPPVWLKIEAAVTRVISALAMALIAWLVINDAGKLRAARTISEYLGLRIAYLAYFMGVLGFIATFWAIRGSHGVPGAPGTKR